MNKCPRKLDQALVEKTVVVPAFQPELLENIVGFVVVPRIKALEKSRVARVLAGTSR